MGKKKSEKKQWTGMPTNSEDLKAIKSSVEATYQYYLDVNTAKGQLKDIYDEIHAKTGIPKKVFNFLAKNNFTGTGSQELAKNDELKEAFEALENCTL